MTHLWKRKHVVVLFVVLGLTVGWFNQLGADLLDFLKPKAKAPLAAR